MVSFAKVLAPCCLLLGISQTAFSQDTVSYAVTYTYDTQGRLTEAMYDDDMRIAYTYDANNNLHAIVTESPHGVATAESSDLPTRFVLHHNYPNPFRPLTTLTFDLPEPADVRIEILDVLGRRVRMLPVQTIPAGFARTKVVDASAWASGVYFYRVRAQTPTRTLIRTGRMVVIN